MVRHNVFFETLGSITEQDTRRPSMFAGLCVLRLVDAVADDAMRDAATEWTGLHGARNAAASIDTGDPARAILLRIVDRLRSDTHLSADTGGALISYGRALDLSAQWPLAADVFQTVVDVFLAQEHPQLHIEAHTARGAAERSMANWRDSARSYAQAQHIADAIGDRAASLTVKVGLAGNHMVRGNLPAAETELNEALAEAREHRLQHVEAIALHDLASVAHSRGDYQRAIHLAYRSLELTTNRTSRDRLLGDIAAAYAGLGMQDAARDGYSIVAMTSPHQWVRWQATLNLMELAIAEGSEARFDEFAAQVESAKLDPRLRAYFLMFRAVGSSRFGREGAEQQFREAHDFAARSQLHQIEFEVYAAMEAASARVPSNTPQTVVRNNDQGRPDELIRIAEALMRLREQATA